MALLLHKTSLYSSNPENPLTAILCGVIGSVVVVFLVIIITMKVTNVKSEYL